MAEKDQAPLREAAFSKSIWEYYIENISDYPGSELGENNRTSILHSIDSLKQYVFVKDEDHSVTLNDDGLLGIESPYLSESSVMFDTPALFHVNLWLVNTKLIDKFEDEGIRIRFSPWLLGNPISGPFNQGDRARDFQEEIRFQVPGLDSELDQLIVDTTFYYLYSTIGLAVLKIGYENFVNSIPDLIPVINDVWQKYLAMLENWVIEDLN